MTEHPIKFTLLCACKNEEEDVHLALDSAVSQTYPHKEIIFVDDSTDRTKEIICGYAHKGVILVDGSRHGCCQARNLGLERATGDVIVFLTADTELEPDYLEKILPHYEQGYDYVMVESDSNLDTVYSRFVQVEHLITANQSGYNPLTTQGYSVRRTAALDVGGISGGNYPVNFCRDWTLVKKMQDKGEYKGTIDRHIRVPHKSADNFKEYWRIQRTRGNWSAYQPYFLFFRSPAYLFFKFTVKSLLTFLEFALVVPAAAHVFKMARNSPKPVWDFFPFYYAYFIHMLAYRVGEWQGWLYISRWNKLHDRPLLGVIH